MTDFNKSTLILIMQNVFLTLSKLKKALCYKKGRKEEGKESILIKTSKSSNNNIILIKKIYNNHVNSKLEKASKM